MNKTDYNQRTALTIKALRILKRVKQVNVANALCLDPSVYSRMENGDVIMTIGEVRIIADTLGISILKILAIVEYEFKAEITTHNVASLATVIMNYIATELKQETLGEFSESDYKKVMNIIQKALKNPRKI